MDVILCTRRPIRHSSISRTDFGSESSDSAHAIHRTLTTSAGCSVQTAGINVGKTRVQFSGRNGELHYSRIWTCSFPYPRPLAHNHLKRQYMDTQLTQVAFYSTEMQSLSTERADLLVARLLRNCPCQLASKNG